MLLDNIAALAAQVCFIVVVDNGSSIETETLLRELEENRVCKVIRNHQNLGIAVALNLGIQHAIETGCDWIATFDQDSRVSNGFILEMLKTYQQVPHPEKIALIAPTYVDRESGVQGTLASDARKGVLTTMTSGSLMPASVVQGFGRFDESLYMDYVDTEFCLRVRRKGMTILQSPAVLFHSLGRTTYHYLFGRRFATTNHSAERRYYITRNRLRLLMRYGTDWPWAWRECKAIISETIKIALIEDNKMKKMRAIVNGTADALRCRLGKQVEL
jgi:rhamnosyltransferase